MKDCVNILISNSIRAAKLYKPHQFNHEDIRMNTDYYDKRRGAIRGRPEREYLDTLDDLEPGLYCCSQRSSAEENDPKTGSKCRK